MLTDFFLGFWESKPWSLHCSGRALRTPHSPARGDVLLTLGPVNCPNQTLGSQTWSALISEESTLLVPLYFVKIVRIFQDP